MLRRLRRSKTINRLGKNRRHRLAEKCICQHFHRLIQLRSIYSQYVSYTCREYVWEVRRHAKQWGKTEGRKRGWLRALKYKKVERHARLLISSSRDTIPLAILSVWENVPKALCSLFNCSAISYSTNSSYNTNSCQMATASITARAK